MGSDLAALLRSCHSPLPFPMLLVASALALLSLQTPPTLVADLNTTPIDSSEFGADFAVRGEALGRLWMDGSRQGVRSMAWTLTAAGAEPEPFVIPQAELLAPLSEELLWVRELGNGRALLALRMGSGAAQPIQLFGTDGTPEGTFNLGVRPFLDYGRETFAEDQPPVDAGVAYLRGEAVDGIQGVFRTDGTVAGTALLAPIGFATGFNQNVWTIGDRVVWAEAKLFPQTPGTDLFSVLSGGGLVEFLAASDSAVSAPDAARVGGVLVFEFRGVDGVSAQLGRELWSTDGTALGTALLADLYVGPDASIPILLSSNGQRAYFSAFTPATGRELWRTDGTTAGTVFVADLAPGTASGVPATNEAAAALGAGLVLRGSSDAASFEPWYSDGTAAGTYQIADLSSNPQGGLPQVFNETFPFEQVGDLVAFSAVPEGLGREPCVTDGVTVTVLGDLNPGSAGSAPRDFTAFEDRVFFAADPPGSAFTGWSAETSTLLLTEELLIDKRPATLSSNPANFVPAGGRGFFSGDPNVVGSLPDAYLYVTDGTAAGSLELEGPATKILPIGTLDGGVVYFRESPLSGFEPYFTDGTPGAGRSLGDLNPGSESSVNPSWGGAQLGRHFYFPAQRPGLGFELARTDGTAGGTELFTEIRPGGADGIAQALDAVVVSGKMVFRGSIGPQSSALFEIDGGPSGAQLVAPQDLGGKIVRDFVEYGNGIAVAALSQSGLLEVFAIDGLTSATTLLYSRGSTQEFVKLTRIGDGLLLFLDDGSLFNPVARLIGIDANGAVETLLPESVGAQFVTSYLATGDLAYFRVGANDAVLTGLWRSDGTAAGTLRVGPLPSSAVAPAGSGGDMLLAYEGSWGPQDGKSLWVTDGTVEGLREFEQSFDCFASLDAFPIGTVGNVCLFSGFSFEGRELHGVDLSEAGGYLTRPFGQGCGLGAFQELAVSGALRPGETVEFELSGLAPLRPAGVYLSLGVGGAVIDDCAIYLANPLGLGLTVLDSEGAGSLSVGVPADPALVGLELIAQGASSVVGGPLLGSFEVTNGVELVFGP